MIEELHFSDITIDQLLLPLLEDKKVAVDVLRLDKIHPLISGNKWFKLRYYFEEAKTQHKKKIITFGGAWSNHILATAAAGKINGFETIGIIRGAASTTLSPTLIAAKELGMQLIFISREEYAQKKLPNHFNTNDCYLIDEGGYGINGADGAATILDFCKKENYTHILCAVGTATMMAGLINGIASDQKVIGISVLKNNYELESSVKALLRYKETHFEIIHDFHFGGYAKHKPALIDFMNSFYTATKIPSDFVYTGKLFFAFNELVTDNYFTPGSKLLLIHSGGLQGNNSLSNGTLIF